MLTGMLFGIAPAWHAFRAEPASFLKQSGSRADTPVWSYFGKGLVAAQLALSMWLMSAAALFLGHVSHLRHLDLGFRRENVLLMVLNPARGGYKREQLAAPYQELLSRLESIPGVRSAAIAGCTPIQGCGATRFVNVEGQAEAPQNRRRIALSWVSPGYFETLGIPLQMGRDFDFRDAGRSRVGIISERMARHYFPDVNAIGKHVRIERASRTGSWYGEDQAYEVMGVTGDAKYIELREAPPPTMYFNMFQENQLFDQFVLRTNFDPMPVEGPARQMVRKVMKTVPVPKITTLSRQVDAAIVPERLVATLSGYFGMLGATLAGIGLYGLLSYAVTRRTSEIGLRMALGATTTDVSRIVMRDALRMVSAGVMAGAAIVLWSAPLAAGVLQDFKPEGAGPLAIAGVVILALAFVAALVPAMRAARVDPMVALRHE